METFLPEIKKRTRALAAAGVLLLAGCSTDRIANNAHVETCSRPAAMYTRKGSDKVVEDVDLLREDASKNIVALFKRAKSNRGKIELQTSQSGQPDEVRAADRSLQLDYRNLDGLEDTVTFSLNSDGQPNAIPDGALVCSASDGLHANTISTGLQFAAKQTAGLSE